MDEKRGIGLEDNIEPYDLDEDLTLDIFGCDEDVTEKNDVLNVSTKVNKGTTRGMQKVYPILLTLSLFVCIYSGYNLIMNIYDKGNTDKVNKEVLQLGKPILVEDTTPYLDVDLSPLKEKNSDVVGWLKVGAVGIDIPIVQTTDNDFYLNNDIEKNKNSGGWVFVDCKSNLDYMTTNTVIYGHNIRGRHFGLLKKLLDDDVSTKEGSNIIQLTTDTKQMVFEIVSVYITDFHNWDYVKSSFSSDEEKTIFANNLKSKNKVKTFESGNLSGQDTFLTFSTCHGSVGTDNRLVVHSRLVESRTIPTN